MKKRVRWMMDFAAHKCNELYFRMKRATFVLRDTSGMSVVELLLILVVIIALVLIFKTQLTELVNTIFSKITSESANI